VATFTNHTLADAVHAGELNVVKLTILTLVTLLQIAETLLEAVEFALEDVGLVHLIGENHQLLLCGELNDGLNVLRAQ
jgi:hypothetical protein